jgi:hypothetical protein
MDSVGNMTVATKGARKTYCQTTGKEKTRISVLMCSTCSTCASGHKFKPLCVVPRKKKIEALEANPNIDIIYATKGF